VRREKDHESIIYDNVNQLFWYLEGIASIVLNDRVRTHLLFGFFEGKLKFLAA